MSARDDSRNIPQPGLDLVECLRLGGTAILHNHASGALIATDAFGTLLFDVLARAGGDVGAAIAATAAELGPAEADIAASARETLERWRDDGLFLAAPPQFPVPVAYRPAEPGAVELWLALGARGAVLHSENTALARDIARALRPMGLETASPPGAEAVRLDVVAAGPGAATGFGVFRDGAGVWGLSGYELARFHLLREIMDALAGPERIAAHLHASAVAEAGRGLVFAGASGSGKSTLAAALIAAGATLAADDHVALAVSGRHLIAFPTRPNLKPGAFDLAEVRAAAAEAAAEAADEAADRTAGPAADATETDTFLPARRAPAGAEIEIAAFVFPQYRAAAENALAPLDKPEALRTLIGTGSRVSRRTRSIAPLLTALDTHPTYRLSYRDTAFAVATCRAIAAG